MTGLIAVNGEITPAEKAKIPAMDRGFLFGDNIFEAMVAFEGVLIDPLPHLKRLEKSAQRLGLTIPWPQEQLLFELNSLAKAANFPKAFIRLVITRGSSQGIAVTEHLTPLRVSYCLPANAIDHDKWNHGIKANFKKSLLESNGSSAKTGNYLASILALEEMKLHKCDEVLWVNPRGEITEASTANIFFVAREGDGIYLVTPPIESGILEGVTRYRIIELLKNAKIPVYEQKVPADEIARFDEAFLSSSVKGLIPISSVNGSPLYTTRNNGVFKQVRRLYDAYIASQLGYYVDWNTGVRVED